MDQNDEDFLDFIENTLILDLKESGNYATAEDFERLLRIIRSEERMLALKHEGLAMHPNG